MDAKSILADEVARRGIDAPNWDAAGRVHDWRNHVPDAVRAIWSTFSQAQRVALYCWAQDLAADEDWD